MQSPHTAEIPRFRLGLILWLAGMLGVVVITVTVLPRIVELVAIPAPVWAISLASLAQSSVLLALAVWAGVALGPAVGLRAPAFESAVTKQLFVPALRAQLLPGLASGLLGGVSLFVLAPTALAEVQERLDPPLLARLLYGGITEELLLRWGLMTAFLWLAWRFLQHRQGSPRAASIWLAIVVSALLFGAGTCRRRQR